MGTVHTLIRVSSSLDSFLAVASWYDELMDERTKELLDDVIWSNKEEVEIDMLPNLRENPDLPISDYIEPMNESFVGYFNPKTSKFTLTQHVTESSSLSEGQLKEIAKWDRASEIHGFFKNCWTPIDTDGNYDAYLIPIQDIKKLREIGRRLQAVRPDYDVLNAVERDPALLETPEYANVKAAFELACELMPAFPEKLFDENYWENVCLLAEVDDSADDDGFKYIYVAH